MGWRLAIKQKKSFHFLYTVFICLYFYDLMIININLLERDSNKSGLKAKKESFCQPTNSKDMMQWYF